MISFVEPLPSGNAVRLILTPPDGARWWRVLRRTADSFAGPVDHGAVIVANESTDHAVLDWTGLVNGTAYFWKAWSWDGVRFTEHPAVTSTPQARLSSPGVDAQELVIQRLEASLANDVAVKRLKPASGKVPVLSAPFASQERIALPCVSVHLAEDAPVQRGIGETYLGIGDDEVDWQDGESWVSRVVLNIVGVSMNADERRALRQAIKRAVMGNLAVFEAAGVQQVNLSQTDDEVLDDGGKAAPLYMASATFECVVPAAAGAPSLGADITDVQLELVE
ncbi:hypothetical protein UFOVP326_14 [uncultured Caudovirales phage]|uniref:Uncharacterized protein n=1 Tax=uncultured Caudovirales phage TaxID=2100421 RepID=A0A6J5LS88_9CAUD|nr:hypothetical protein UFOVP326_14 [uncultured Caudovirales phage]